MATDQLVPTTPEDLLNMQDGGRYELLEGRLIEKPTSPEAVWIARRLIALLNTYGAAQQAGLAFPDGAAYQCFPSDPSLVRRPEVSFLRRGRLSPEQFAAGHCRIAPDLAVEIVSPANRYSEVEQRVHDFLAAGTPLVWVVSPKNGFVRVHRIDGSVADVRQPGALHGETVLPGFECRVADLQPPRDLAQIL